MFDIIKVNIRNSKSLDIDTNLLIVSRPMADEVREDIEKLLKTLKQKIESRDLYALSCQTFRLEIVAMEYRWS